MLEFFYRNYDDVKLKGLQFAVQYEHEFMQNGWPRE
jgi:hypothetical protein